MNRKSQQMNLQVIVVIILLLFLLILLITFSGGFLGDAFESLGLFGSGLNESLNESAGALLD